MPKNGMLTRAEMVDVIKGGGSVMIGGRVIDKLEDLPSAEEMAQTPEDKSAVADDIKAQMAALSARLSALEPSTDTEPVITEESAAGKGDPVTSAETEKPPVKDPEPVKKSEGGK